MKIEITISDLVWPEYTPDHYHIGTEVPALGLKFRLQFSKSSGKKGGEPLFSLWNDKMSFTESLIKKGVTLEEGKKIASVIYANKVKFEVLRRVTIDWYGLSTPFEHKDEK